jgi:hypothetical protein
MTRQIVVIAVVIGVALAAFIVIYTLLWRPGRMHRCNNTDASQCTSSEFSRLCSSPTAQGACDVECRTARRVNHLVCADACATDFSSALCAASAVNYCRGTDCSEECAALPKNARLCSNPVCRLQFSEQDVLYYCNGCTSWETCGDAEKRAICAREDCTDRCAETCSSVCAELGLCTTCLPGNLSACDSKSQFLFCAEEHHSTECEAYCATETACQYSAYCYSLSGLCARTISYLPPARDLWPMGPGVSASFLAVGDATIL